MVFSHIHSQITGLQWKEQKHSFSFRPFPPALEYTGISFIKMAKLIDLSAITKLTGYETSHLLLRFVFNEIFIEAFHSEFEVIDFYSVKTDTS